jgi:hypothetical protein
MVAGGMVLVLFDLFVAAFTTSLQLASGADAKKQRQRKP